MSKIETPDGRLIDVPCGKCIACLINKRSDWCIRLEQEHKHSTSAHFITLTYDTRHYPSDGNLNKRHLQNYLKRLRKRDGTNRIRYFAVGEYGTKSGRAHYHILLFNSENEDATIRAWCDSKGNSIGIVHIGKVTSASIAYCTKYIVQPPESIFNRTPAFSTMSRKYGLGAKYLTDAMVDWHRTDDRNYIQYYDQKRRLPRFYREKIWPTIANKISKTKDNTGKEIRNKVPLTHLQQYIKTSLEQDRQRVSKRAMKLSLANQEKENDYYRTNYGTNWKNVKAEFRNAILERVKKKVAFTQTI